MSTKEVFGQTLKDEFYWHSLANGSKDKKICFQEIGNIDIFANENQIINNGFTFQGFFKWNVILFFNPKNETTFYLNEKN